MLDLILFPMFPQVLFDFIEKFLRETQIHLDIEEKNTDLRMQELPRLRGGDAPTVEWSGCRLRLAWFSRSVPGWMR